MTFLNTLAWWQWMILAAVPPAIVALYFLKLKRQPLEVPSTYLWSRTIEDLHVNTIWQRLRQSLLLFLQLLLMALIIFACLRPGWLGSEMVGGRYIFLVDTSASMSATDIEPTRLEVAKRRIAEQIDQMRSDEVAMIISFSDVARVEQPFTDNRRLLRSRLDTIRPTNRSTDLSEALRAAAGLANPGRIQQEAADIPLADAMPATLYIYSDGGFAPVRDFTLGNLHPEYFKLGQPQPNNVAVTAFTTERNPENPTQMQAFARLENFTDQDLEVDVTLSLDDSLYDAIRIQLPALGSNGIPFELGDIEAGVLKLEIEYDDDLPLDNVAYAAISTPRLANVLVVTPRNDALQLALGTEEALKLADVQLAGPESLETNEYQNQAEIGAWDLIIYDQCVPQQMPQASTLFIGNLPPLEQWQAAGPRQGPPLIIDTNQLHPLMQLVDMSNVNVAEGMPLEGPPGSTSLIRADIGTVFAVAPRGSYEDAVLGFDMLTVGEEGTEVNTDWPIRRSFPVFVLNVLRYLGGSTGDLAAPNVRPGGTVELRSDQPAERLTVSTPAGRQVPITRDANGKFVFTQTEALGAYEVHDASGHLVQRFTVNLFDNRESDLRPADLQIGYEEIVGQTTFEPTRVEAWKWLLLAGLGVLVFEWYIYNRRVYL